MAPVECRVTIEMSLSINPSHPRSIRLGNRRHGAGCGNGGRACDHSSTWRSKGRRAGHRSRLRSQSYSDEIESTETRPCLSRRAGTAVRLLLPESDASSCRGYCIEAIGFSTISPSIGPSAPSNSFFSRSGTLNLFSVATRSPTSASKSLLLTPMPAWVLFMSRPV